MNQEKNSGRGSGIFWMLVPVALLVTSVSGWLFMVSLALDDPGFSLEADYYKKAANYDEVIAQRAANTQLGWQVDLVEFASLPQGAARLQIRLTDDQKRGVNDLSVSAEGFPTARGTQRQDITFEAGGDGLYFAQLMGARPGIWEIRIRAENRVLFTYVLRAELVKAGHS